MKVSSSPQVTIIMATHNRAYIIKRAIKSVLNQTFKNYELIIVNDGSTDNTKKVVKSFKDKRIIYFEKKHGGLASARNLGLKYAAGEYIAYLDDDDFYRPNHLEELSIFLDTHPEVGMVYSDSIRILNNTRIPTSASPDFDKRRLEIGNFIPNCALMHRKECIDKVGFFDERIIASSDKDMWLRISDAYQVAHLPKVTNVVYIGGAEKLTCRSNEFYYYIIRKRIHKAKKEKRFSGYINGCAIGIIRNLLAFKKIKQAKSLALEFYRFTKNYRTIACLGICSLAEGKFNSAKKKLNASIKKLPKNWQNYDLLSKENILTIKASLAQSHFHLGNIKGAEKACSNILEIMPGHNEARIILAICKMRKGLWKSALRSVRDIEFSPMAYNIRGYYYFRERKYGWAVAEFRKAVFFDPKRAIYHYNLACAYLGFKKNKSAFNEYRQVLNLEPNHPGAKKALKPYLPKH